MKNKTKCILITTDSFSAYKFQLPLAKFLVSKGINTEIACSDKEYSDAGSFIDEILQSGIILRKIPIEREISPIGEVKALYALVKLLKKEQYDIVHTSNSKAGILGRIAAKIAGIRVIVHSSYDYTFIDSSAVGKKWFFVVLEKIAALVSDRIYFISKIQQDKCFQYGITHAEKTVYIGPVGLNPEEFDPDSINEADKSEIRERFGIDTPSCLIGTVARLVPHKGIDVFIRAAALVIKNNPDCKFIVVGGGPLLGELKELSRSEGIEDNMIYTGFVNDSADIPVLMSVFEIFCLPTKSEGFGIVFAEAGVLGKPVIGCDLPPMNYAIEHNVTGFTVSVDNVEGFANAMIRLVEDKELREKMGLAGRKRSIELFDEKIAYEKIRQDYFTLMKK